MICSSVNLFFTSNLLFLGLDSRVNCYSNPGGRRFKTQICIACDAPKLCAARISALEAPKYDNTENTLEELIARIDKTVAWLQTVPAGAIDGQEAKEITFPVGKAGTRTMSAEDYLKTWALPNMFFHITTAYAILRHNGVVLGKGDFLAGALA